MRVLALWLALLGALAGQARLQPLEGPITYHPPFGILDDRHHTFDLFLDFPEDSVMAVSLHFRTDSMLTYRELPMQGTFGRWQVVVPAVDLHGTKISWFFTVELTRFRLYGYPLAADNTLQPFTAPLVPPTKAFFQRLFRKW